MSEMTLRFAARSEIGRVRRNNEDSGYAGPRLLVVADGMGGHEAGELASAATVGAVVNAAASAGEAGALPDLLANAVVTSGEYIADVVARNRELAGMGTTLTALALREDRIAIAHVGDSRAYLMRDGELQQLTKDHTFVQTLVDAGQITPDEAAVHPRRNLMMRAIDGIHAVEVDLSVREARLGDRFLLCSDGLCGVLTHEAIAVVMASDNITQCVTDLIDVTMDLGAPDNVTVVVAEVVDDGSLADAVVIGAAADKDTHDRLPGVDLPAEAVRAAALIAAAGKRAWKKFAVSTVAAVLVIGAIGAAWLANQWYVGVNADRGYVAIYQGIPVAGLSRLIETTDVATVNLPDYERGQVVSTITAHTLQDARSTVSQLATRAQTCVSFPQTPGCPAP